MASGFVFYSFNWNAFQNILNTQVEELAEWFSDYLVSLQPDGFDPQIHSAENLKRIFSKENWYARDSQIEFHIIDNLVFHLFDSGFCDDEFTRPLRVEALNESVYFDLHNSVFRKLKEMDELDERLLQEMNSIGNRPFTNGVLISYTADYSIHSPGQVKILQKALDMVESSFRDDEPNEELSQDFFEAFYEPVQATAKQNRALYIWSDT